MPRYSNNPKNTVKRPREKSLAAHRADERVYGLEEGQDIEKWRKECSERYGFSQTEIQMFEKIRSARDFQAHFGENGTGVNLPGFT